MSNYSDNPASCRVDFFKKSGKWYTTEAITFTSEEGDMLLTEAFQSALRRHCGERLRGTIAICLEPYHKNSHPVMADTW